MMGKSWQQEIEEASDHIAFACEKQKVMNVYAWLDFFVLCNWGPKLKEILLSVFGSSPTSVNLIMIIPSSIIPRG